MASVEVPEIGIPLQMCSENRKPSLEGILAALKRSYSSVVPLVFKEFGDTSKTRSLDEDRKSDIVMERLNYNFDNGLFEDYTQSTSLDTDLMEKDWYLRRPFSQKVTRDNPVRKEPRKEQLEKQVLTSCLDPKLPLATTPGAYFGSNMMEISSRQASPVPRVPYTHEITLNGTPEPEANIYPSQTNMNEVPQCESYIINVYQPIDDCPITRRIRWLHFHKRARTAGGRPSLEVSQDGLPCEADEKAQVWMVGTGTISAFISTVVGSQSVFIQLASAVALSSTVTAFWLPRRWRKTIQVLTKFGSMCCLITVAGAVGKNLPHEYLWVPALLTVAPAVTLLCT